MSSARWQRHSTFLSVRWRTWIGRAAYGVGVLTNVGVRLAGVWDGSSGVPPPVGRWWHPTEIRQAFQPATYRRPVSYQAARGQLNGAVCDGC